MAPHARNGDGHIKVVASQLKGRTGWEKARCGGFRHKELALKLGSGLVKAPLYDGSEKLLHDVKRNAHYV